MTGVDEDAQVVRKWTSDHATTYKNQMRFQLASDLHLEAITPHFPRERLISPAPDADLLVLAGDIHNGSAAVRLFADWPVPVVYIAGNHEAFDGNLESVLQKLASEAAGTSIHFLERHAYYMGGVRFLGCTLWTDYRLYGSDEATQRVAQQEADRHMYDRHVITSGPGHQFTAELALKEHERARGWLETELRQPFEGKTVVVTHHAPHPLSIHEKYKDDPTNPAFVSNLTDLLGYTHVWAHGHCHDNSDYRIGTCRVVANPRGYARRPAMAGAVHDLRFQNTNFIPNLVIDTEAR